MNRNDLAQMTDDELQAFISAAVQEFGRRRYDAGRAAMRESILRAAGEPVAPAAAPKAYVLNAEPGSFQIKGSDATLTRIRAPRGSVGKALEIMMTERPGRTANQYEEEAAKRFPDIAAKSIGNELRRLSEIRYRRIGPGWVLIKDGGQTGAAAPAADMQQEAEGGEAQ